MSHITYSLRLIRRGCPAWAKSKLMTALLSALFMNCATPRPYYSGFHFEAPALVESDRSRMVVYLDWMIRSEKVKQLTVITPEGGEQSLYPRDNSSPPTIDWLPLPILFATCFILNPKYKGLEVDLIVEAEGDGYSPVTALAEPDGSIRVEMGVSSKSLIPLDREITREELRLRFGIGAVIDGERNWQPLELYSLEQALLLLSPQERLITSGVAFIRQQRAERTSKGIALAKVWGQYHGQADTLDKREIRLFDTDDKHDTSLFIGEPSRPYPISTMCLLHEIGHAIADYARVRVIYERNQQISVHKRLNEAADAAVFFVPALW